MTIMWIKCEKYMLVRLDLLERFEIEKTQEDLGKLSPMRSIGGPASRLCSVHGWFRDGDTLARFTLREGIKSWDNAERAISRLIREMTSDQSFSPSWKEFTELSDGERVGQEP